MKNIMDKIKINNQVVMMRKFVKQAKVHVINKLVKQSKFLRQRKGNEKQVLKAKRKEERILAEIVILKKMKPDYISKLALAKSKNWKDILEQKNSSVEDRCIAILANHETVQEEVEKFYNKNIDLVPNIASLLKEWEEKNADEKLKGNSIKHEKNKFVHKQKYNRKDKPTFSPENTVLNSKIYELKEKKENAADRIEPVLKQRIDTLSTTKVSGEQNESIDFNERSSNQKKKIVLNPAVSCDNIDLEDLNNSDHDKNTAETNAKEENYFEGKEIFRNFQAYSEAAELDEEMKSSDESNSAYEDQEMNISDREIINFDIKGSSESETERNNCVNDLSDEKQCKKELKTITVLHLEDLKDFDEIPINSESENNQDVEEEITQSKNDPFFLGLNETVSSANEDLEDTKIERNKDAFLKNPPYNIEKLDHSNNRKFNRYSKNVPYETYKLNSSNRRHFSEDDRGRMKNDSFRNRFLDRNCKRLDKSINRDFQMHKKKDFRNGENSFKRYEKVKFQVPNERSFQRTDKTNFKNRESHYEAFSRNATKMSLNRNITTGSSFQSNGFPSSNAKSKVKDTPLHPSWEAKRKLKEAERIKICPSKRIVFED